MPRKPSRYLLLKVETDDAIPEEAIHLSVTESVLTLFGETGLAEISPRLFDYDEKTLTGIVKCTRGSVDKLRASHCIDLNVCWETCVCLRAGCIWHFESTPNKRTKSEQRHLAF